MAHTTHPAISPAMSVRLDTRWKPTGVRLLYLSRLRLLPSAVQSASRQTFLSQVGLSLSTTAKEPESAAPCFTKMYASVLSRPSESALAAVILP